MNRICYRRTQEDGVTAVLTIIISIVLLGSVSFAVDMGNAMQTQRKSQTAADSAAFAGVQTFDTEMSKPLVFNSTLGTEEHFIARETAAVNMALSEASSTAKRNFPGLNFDEVVAGELCGQIPAGYLTSPALHSNCFSLFTGSANVPARVRVVLPARTKALFGQSIGADTISAEATATITGIEAGQNLTGNGDQDPTYTSTTIAAGGETTTTAPAVESVTTTTAAPAVGSVTTTTAAPAVGSVTTTTAAPAVGNVTTTTVTPSTTTTAVTATTVPVSTTGPCSPGNLLTNGGFESGFVGWSGTNSPAVGSAYAREGSKVAWVHSVGSIFQTVAATPGQQYETTFFGGTHDPTNNASVAMEFLNSSGSVLSSSFLPMDTDVDIAPGLVGGPYRWKLTAPVGTVNVRVNATVTDKDWVNLDGVSIIGCGATAPTTTAAPTTTVAPTTTTTAAAGIPLKCAICVMSPSGTTTTNNGSTGEVTAVGGDIYIHSASSAALVVNGGFVVTTPVGMFANVVGGLTWNGGAVPANVRTGQPTRSDPLAYMSTPTPNPAWPARSTPAWIRSNTTIASGIYNSAIGWNNSTLTLNPGVYNGLSAGGAVGTKLILKAGQYIFTGPVDLKGLAQFTTGNSGADEVSMYFTCKSTSSGSPAPCTASNMNGAGQLSTGGTSDLVLRPPTNGSQRGISIFYDRANINPLSLSGNSTFNVGGIYALKSSSNIGGTTAMISSSSVVVGLLAMNGTGQVRATYDASKLP